MSNPFFRFRKGTKVTNQGYQFIFDTNIYLASGLLITPKQILDAHAQDGKVELIGQLRPDILSGLIQCIGACEDVGLKYLRMLGLHP